MRHGLVLRRCAPRLALAGLGAVLTVAGAAGCTAGQYAGPGPSRPEATPVAQRRAARPGSASRVRLSEVRLSSVRDRVSWGPRAFLCRAEPEPVYVADDARQVVRGASDEAAAQAADPRPGAAPGARVMFTAIGQVTNRRCDSVYDPQTDRLVRFHSPVGFRVRDGWLALDAPDDAVLDVEIVERFVRDARGVSHHSGPLDKSRFPSAPSGWCSWYLYYQDIDEGEILRNARWMAEHLRPFGAEYVQVDDGWQGVGRGMGDNRDWETVCPRFPHGMKWLAERIRELGMKPGLWIAPHGQSNTEFVRQRAEAFIWRADGTSAGESASDPADPRQFNWVGRYVVDTSGTPGQAYLRSLFERLAQEWGYEYFKIDGQPLVQQLYREQRARLADPEALPADAYRAGLRVIREAIGPRRYLLGCWGTPWWGAGILDGSRTGEDVSASWEGMRNALASTWERYWTHNVVWYADPDCICVRPPMPLEQARVWASVLGLTGQSLFVSDRMDQLPPERVELLKRIFPPADIRPMNLHALDPADAICLKIDDAAGRRDVVGVFNWSEEPRTIALSPDGLGLEPDDYLVYDVWDRRLIGRLESGVEVPLEPTSCRVLCIRRVEPDRPTLIGTSRHITQGAVDVASIEARGSRFVGASRLVAGDPYEIRFLVRPGGVTFELFGASADGARVELRAEGPVAVLTLTADANRLVEWSVSYAVPGG